ncbi:mRNA turnover 4 [Chytridiales sp. JEL 0842]|nr:mRNA turnover 4 [Chytridiales sp. JEL 0842]
MPRSKRNKVVSLTKTEKKGRDSKDKLFEKIREAADTYKHVYIFSRHNERNAVLKTLRHGPLKETSKFFMGSNKVMAKALGTDRETEYKEGLGSLAGGLKGNVGLLFSNEELETIERHFTEAQVADFARMGLRATRTVTIPEGPLQRRIEPVNLSELDPSEGPHYLPTSSDELMPFPNNMETQLRSLGVPTLLKGGVILLMREYQVCKQGEILSANQAQVLKHLNLKMAVFKLRVLGRWTDGVFERLVSEEEQEAEGEGSAGEELMEEDDE